MRFASANSEILRNIIFTVLSLLSFWVKQKQKNKNKQNNTQKKKWNKIKRQNQTNPWILQNNVGYVQANYVPQPQHTDFEAN